VVTIIASKPVEPEISFPSTTPWLYSLMCGSFKACLRYTNHNRLTPEQIRNMLSGWCGFETCRQNDFPSVPRRCIPKHPGQGVHNNRIEICFSGTV
jgi:hypothetical protein